MRSYYFPTRFPSPGSEAFVAAFFSTFSGLSASPSSPFPLPASLSPPPHPLRLPAAPSPTPSFSPLLSPNVLPFPPPISPPVLDNNRKRPFPGVQTWRTPTAPGVDSKEHQNRLRTRPRTSASRPRELTQMTTRFRLTRAPSWVSERVEGGRAGRGRERGRVGGGGRAREGQGVESDGGDGRENKGKKGGGGIGSLQEVLTVVPFVWLCCALEEGQEKGYIQEALLSVSAFASGIHWGTTKPTGHAPHSPPPVPPLPKHPWQTDNAPPPPPLPLYPYPSPSCRRTDAR